jgi:hypothetical protein
VEPIEDVIARAEERAIREWAAEQAPPPPWMEGIDEDFRADVIKTWYGYRAEHIGSGLTELANCWPWAFTRKGIRRKVERIRRRYFLPPDVVEVIRYPEGTG